MNSIFKPLLYLCWSLWGLAALGSVIWLMMAGSGEASNRIVARAIYQAALLALFVFMIGTGLGIYWAAHRQSIAGLAFLAMCIALPMALAARGPVVGLLAERRLAQEHSRIGRFQDPQAREMARAILADDPEKLRALLNGARPPTVVDPAGMNLLVLAVWAMIQGKASIGPMEVLLEAGADARTATFPDGRPLVLALEVDLFRVPEGLRGIELLLTHGADANALDGPTGVTALQWAGALPDLVRLLLDHQANMETRDTSDLPAVVRFIANQHLNSAVILIERGARLDTVSRDGSSVDSYLQRWREETAAADPEGRARVLSAIEQRRPGASPPPHREHKSQG